MAPRRATRRLDGHWPVRLAYFSATIALLAAARMAWVYADQPPLDILAFRQSQTALTAFWAARQGLMLAYETPVAGLPWSIPFEFPIYQWLVAGLSRITGSGIDPIGRLTSFFFLLACLFPVRSIIRRLELPPLTFPIFAGLLFTSPLYLYWGRSLMMETTAVFFALLAIRYFVDLETNHHVDRATWAFPLAMTTCLLQKATTGLPVVLVLGVLWLILQSKRTGSAKELISNASTWRRILGFALPVMIAGVWTIYTDHVKALNPLGLSLTSAALSKWNWGSFQQRFDTRLYSEVLWHRMLVKNLSAQLGIALLALPFVFRNTTRVRVIALVCLVMGVGPLFLFTNLHLIHDYYQTANLIFLLFGVALAIGACVSTSLGNTVAVILLVIMMVSNTLWFRSGYLPTIKARFDAGNSRDVAVSDVIRRQTAEGEQFVAFGHDWNSTFAYLSQRKSLTVANFHPRYAEVISAPERFVEVDRLGAVVTCTPGGPAVEKLIEWTSKRQGWMIGETQGCFIAVREPPLDTGPALLTGESPVCQGDLQLSIQPGAEGKPTQTLFGWSVSGVTADASFGTMRLELFQDAGKPLVLGVIAIHRTDVLSHLGEVRQLPLGFYRLLTEPIPIGHYTARLVRGTGQTASACRFAEPLVVPAPAATAIRN
jgi:hypothetical protein